MANPGTVSSFSNAIAIGEGFGASPNNKPTRTLNPGDLDNTATSTKAFGTIQDGWAALDGKVTNIFDGNSHTYNPNLTVAQFGALYSTGSAKNTSSDLAKNLPGLLGVPSSTTLAQIASGAVAIKQIPRPTATGTATPTTPVATGSSNPASSVAYLTDDSDPAVAVPVSGMTVSSDQLAGLLNAVSPSLIINTGLGQPAWNQDSAMLQTNGPAQAVGYPVTFQIFFNLNQDPLPVVISLNASLRSHQKTMRHVASRQRTLTGLLVNFWGAAPDQISGQASTGLMANQLGITDFLSLSTASQSIKDRVLQGLDPAALGEATTLESQMESEGFFRVAAKDAFVEFLSLFKNNGTVWFRNQNYTGYTTGMEQMGADAWSPATGSTTFQNAARRNDVMTRGKVVMYFRNTAYYGYFKNLTWAMDAATPFRWNFNFTFQVESTITNVGVPGQ